MLEENAELSQKIIDLQNRLSHLESEISDQKILDTEREDLIDSLKDEIQLKDLQLTDMEDKNRRLTKECQLLTKKILEEKNKMIEIMN